MKLDEERANTVHIASNSGQGKIKFQIMMLYSSAPQYFCNLPGPRSGQRLKVKTSVACDLIYAEKPLKYFSYFENIFGKQTKNKEYLYGVLIF